ncbi:hypothetical protein BDW02DRAFT_619997 [Decorospora gaudefroyi]|uniref:Uncharacterized protein n=1 Tax=Decorospora gaudefroyi TaxID=184978 RepID=A0A6A5KKB1_9PLEO|nr:hypothetical protein BDW02DRAFT_619997 [Decorospora gaudefroyi]
MEGGPTDDASHYLHQSLRTATARMDDLPPPPPQPPSHRGDAIPKPTTITPPPPPPPPPLPTHLSKFSRPMGRAKRPLHQRLPAPPSPLLPKKTSTTNPSNPSPYSSTAHSWTQKSSKQFSTSQNHQAPRSQLPYPASK